MCCLTTYVNHHRRLGRRQRFLGRQLVARGLHDVFSFLPMGLLDRVRIGTRTIRTTRRSLSKLMGQQAAE